MKIYSNGPGNIFVQSSLIAADLAGQNVELVYMSDEDRKSKEWKAKHITGKFPLLELESGETLFESATIAKHFARCAPSSGLLGNTPFETAQVDDWIVYSQQVIWRSLGPVAYAALGHSIVKQEDFNKHVKAFKANLKKLNDHLKGKHFLVGESLTVADVIVACSLIVGFQTVLDAGFRKGMPAVSEWFERCVGLPSFVRRLGYIKMTEKAWKAYDPAAKPQEIKAEAPKEAKKEAKKEEDDMDDLFGDDDEDDAEAAKKAAEAAKDAAKKKKKKEVIAMSIVMLEVKPLDDTINLDELASKLFAEITQDGLFWKTEYKKEPVAFGIYKLIVGFSLEDEKVSVDGVVERIEEMEDFVQSVEIAAFNKI